MTFPQIFLSAAIVTLVYLEPLTSDKLKSCQGQDGRARDESVRRIRGLSNNQHAASATSSLTFHPLPYASYRLTELQLPRSQDPAVAVYIARVAYIPDQKY